MKKDKFKIEKEKRDKLIDEIKTFYYEEHDEEIGDLKASIILDFFIEKLAPEIYNIAIYDSYKYIQDKAEDLLSLEK
ncbi:DUF2164 domain-containing protein [Clostridium sp. BJN0001]|uniref:DUF2164 domain-containing protein n=1 Tax=Clostridium sp. BJN0001 TaxID=2930219 RepID=UPI001FD1B770|nr:DUF2164 domain-containing protein [Clostridium sp. BJN0001]